MRRAAPLLLLFLCGCRAVQGAVIGGATGAGLSGTPQGAGIGAAAGFLTGAWDDITAWVTGLWHGWFGGGLAPAPPAPSFHLVEWLLIGLAIYFVWKFATDYEFRQHLFRGTAKLAQPKPTRRPNVPQQ